MSRDPIAGGADRASPSVSDENVRRRGNRFKPWQRPAKRPYIHVMERRFTSHRLQSAKGASGVEESPSEAAEKAAGPAEVPARADGDQASAKTAEVPATPRPKEIGGPSGPEPTRYGDWERNGICYDF